MAVDSSDFDECLSRLRSIADEPTGEDIWPGQQFQAFADAGVLGWVIPPEFGGSGISGSELTHGYRQLAGACLLSTFVLTQRNGACQRIAGSDNDVLKHDLLPRMCSGDIFATVGISHLTTSRQHLSRPSVSVNETSNGFVADGFVPWVTGGQHADILVTGGTLDDGRQVLLAIDTQSDGVEFLPSAKLLALSASSTGPARLNGVHVGRDCLIAGPVEGVMAQGKGGGAGSLTTSALAIGVTEAALNRLREETDNRPDLVEVFDPLNEEFAALRNDLELGLENPTADASAAHSAESVRRRANSLVLRATQAGLAASKGAGFVKGHPAERAVREAMFFLVWSCPQPVLAANLRQLACAIGE